MKRELKNDNSQIISISDNGTVTIPSETKMSISEIADLFGIYYQTAKRHIRAIKKSKIIRNDNSTDGCVEGMKIHSEYYGLDMIIALSFRINTREAEIFRKWFVHKVNSSSAQQIIIIGKDWNQKASLN